jgi:multicomponent Na+:H+ antiporter subunit F
MPDILLYISFVCLLLCVAMLLYRIARGPEAPDRAMAIDIIGVVVVCFTALMSLKTGKDYYLNIGIAWAMLSFIGAIALAKHLEGKGFDE